MSCCVGQASLGVHLTVSDHYNYFLLFLTTLFTRMSKIEAEATGELLLCGSHKGDGRCLMFPHIEDNPKISRSRVPAV